MAQDAAALDLGNLTEADLAELPEDLLQQLHAHLHAEKEADEHAAVTLREFCENPAYLGGSNQWPSVVDELEAIGRGGPAGPYNELILASGIGSGKSCTAAVAMVHQAFVILPDLVSGAFQARHNLSDKPVSFFILASRAEQAKASVYREVRGRIESSPWFSRFPLVPRLRSSIVFTHAGEPLPLEIKVMPSREEAVLAADTYCIILDELSYLVDSRGVMGDSASEIYERLKSRMVSRFAGDGLLILSSAPRHADDFVQRRIREVQDGGEQRVYFSRRPTWKCKPDLIAEVEAGNFFEFEHPGTKRTLRVPLSLAGQCSRDPQLFARDFLAWPMSAVAPFDKHAATFLEACRDLKLPPDVNTHLDAYVHIDIGLKADACALALVIAEGDSATVQRVEIVPPRPDTKEVELSDIREQIRAWRSEGWFIRGVSADSFASEGLLQELRRDGFEVKVLSVDRTPVAYIALKAAIHEHRFHYFDSDVTRIFETEYQGLELIDGVKVDHGPRGSKDVSDAIAGAVCEALANAHRQWDSANPPVTF